MASISSEVLEDRVTWEKFLKQHPEANFLHSWYWGEFHHRLGHRVIRRGYYSDGRLVGVMLAIVEPARQRRHLVIPAGPIMDWSNNKLVKLWISDVKRIARDQRCIFVRLRPQLFDTPENRKLFKLLGFRRAPMHVTADLTSQLSLGKSNEDLLKAMRKGTRYELNQARKLKLEIQATADTKYIQEFCDLQKKTAKRQHFVPFSNKFLSEQFKVFAEDKHVLMYRASYNNRLLAMAFVIFYGSEAAYHYGASTDLARKIPGAYAIQWEAIQEARKRGCSRYNFWGVTEHGKTKHRFYGVSVFKRGFGGEDVAYVPAQDLVINHVRYPLTFSFETARRKLRKL